MDLTFLVLTQLCFDPDCKGFRSEPIKLPENITKWEKYDYRNEKENNSSSLTNNQEGETNEIRTYSLHLICEKLALLVGTTNNTI